MSAQNFQETSKNLRLMHEQTQLESWRLMHTFLGTLQMHHLLCAESSDDQETVNIHTEIANLLKRTDDQYKRLLNNNHPHAK